MPTPRLLGAVLGLIGAATFASPPQTAAGSPTTPPPVAAVTCDVSPRSRDEIVALSVDPDIATPAATTAGQTLPEGSPVAADTAAQIEAIVRLWLACQNGGEQLRAWALFSDGYLSRLLARQGAPSAIGSLAATPAGHDHGGAELLDIRGERELPDGRLGATVVIAYPSVPMPKTFFFFFTEHGGRLLIDGILGEISFAVP